MPTPSQKTTGKLLSQFVLEDQFAPPVALYKATSAALSDANCSSESGVGVLVAVGVSVSVAVGVFVAFGAGVSVAVAMGMSVGVAVGVTVQEIRQCQCSHLGHVRSGSLKTALTSSDRT